LNPREILHIQRLLFTNPNQAWEIINKASYGWRQIFGYYLIPLLFLSSLAIVFFMGRQFEHLGISHNQMFFINLFSSLGAIFISSQLIANLAPRFNAIRSFDKNIALIAFSNSPVYIASVISSMHEALQIFNLAAVVLMMFIFFKGTLVLLDTPPHKQLGFTITSLIILFATRFIILLFLAMLMGIGKV
jgi:hypothetical protein